VRQAARHITQFYDHFLALSGLRTTQFSILAKLRRLGPMTINALAAEMVMDRTTLGRNILPLERDGLIAVQQGSRDRRSKELRNPISHLGICRHAPASVSPIWRAARLWRSISWHTAREYRDVVRQEVIRAN
jgi:DNA-binding transcriptional ArsR family regulator